MVILPVLSGDRSLNRLKRDLSQQLIVNQDS